MLCVALSQARLTEIPSLNLPVIAARTLQSFSAHPVLGPLYKNARKHLSRVFSPIVRAKWAHQQIDQHIQTLFKDPVVAKYSACKKGCSACCHSQVSMNADEAELLALKVVRGEVSIDVERLVRQAEAGNDAKEWYQLKYAERGCVFLNSEGECSVYADRPGVCRTNYAVSTSEFCSTEDGIEKPIRLLNTQAADMIIAASFQASKSGGALPVMLWNAITRLSEKKKTPKSPRL